MNYSALFRNSQVREGISQDSEIMDDSTWQQCFKVSFLSMCGENEVMHSYMCYINILCTGIKVNIHSKIVNINSMFTVLFILILN